MSAWSALSEHAEKARGWNLAQMLDSPGRFAEFSLGCAGSGSARLFLDYSRQKATAATLHLLQALAEARGMEAARAALLAGEVVNVSENRPALHPDARSADPGDKTLGAARGKTERFARRFRAGEARGVAGKPLKRVVNIGIGGSDLGVRLLCSALGGEQAPAVDFVAEMDGVELEMALSRNDPAETLFVLCSKSFSTAETLANAYSARHWITAALGEDAPARHFAAVSSDAGAMKAWGIAPDMAFPMPDAIGGRYSIWSAAGLSAWLSLGPASMHEFLAGGRWMDRHFREAPPDANLPVLLALMAFWNQSLLGCPTQLLLPYDTRLKFLPAYLQQLEMESLGKGVDAEGQPLEGEGVAALLGATGSSAQHSIMQWAQQGKRAVCADFIAARDGGGAYPRMHGEALRQMLAQAEALARGLPQVEIGSDPLAAHKALPGGRASNLLLLERLDPWHLGALIALYEHKVFVQAKLLGVNPFDQWGVEHAKRLAADPGSQPPFATLLHD